jgi:SulP family sulfate permease
MSHFDPASGVELTVSCDLDLNRELKVAGIAAIAFSLGGGSMGLYRKTVRIASVIVDRPSVLYFLSTETFERIETTDPLLASHLHRFIVNLLAERLHHRGKELQHLLETA